MNETPPMDWERLFERSSDQSIQNHPQFIEIIKQVYHCESRHIVVNAGGNSFGIPCYRVTSPLSGRKMTSCPFNFYPPNMGAGDEVTAIRELIALAKKEGPKWYVEYKTFADIPPDQTLDLNLVKLEPSVVSQLTLKSSYEDQVRSYRKRLRESLKTTKRRAQDGGLSVDWAQGISELRPWYELMVKLYRDKHRMITQPWTLLRMFYEKGFGKLLVAKEKERVVGGIFLICSARQWNYCWAAYDARFSDIGINKIIIDEAIKRAIENNVQIFDFGSSDESDEDLIFFKSRWGCDHRKIRYYYWNHKPKQISLNSSFSLPRFFLPFVPLSILRRIPSVLVPLLA